jgi:hypothetical protein
MAQSKNDQGERDKGKDKDQGKDEQIERYRQAAEDALQQLDWAIGYLHGIRKTDVSRALAKNRSYIRRHLLGRDEEAVPSQTTDET